MKKRLVLVILLILGLFCHGAWAKDDKDTPTNTNHGGSTTQTPPPQNPPPPNNPYTQEKESGLYVGGDSGVFVPLGSSSNVLSVQFLSAAKFGYSLKRRFNFELRLLTGFGQAERNSSNTFLFITEFDTKVRLLKKAFSPYLMGGVGFYVLSFNGFDPRISSDTNLTYVGGGGFDYLFGSNSVGLGVNYRGFINDIRNFQGMDVMIEYAFHFF